MTKEATYKGSKDLLSQSTSEVVENVLFGGGTLVRLVQRIQRATCAHGAFEEWMRCATDPCRKMDKWIVSTMQGVEIRD